MSAFATMSLAALVAHFNAIPGVTPVKKFASKEAAIKRIEAVELENAAARFMDPNGPEAHDAGIQASLAEETVEPVEGADPVTLTNLEYALLDWCAFNLYTTENGGEPQSASSVNVWFWPDEIATELGITEQGVGGVASSLVKKGLASVAPNEEPAGQPSSAAIAFTEEGFAAWKSVYEIEGRWIKPEGVEKLETGATDEEAAAILDLSKPVETTPPVSGGFQYLTRDALKALAEADAAARAAYRIERRKAARAARKAKKAPKAA